MPVWQTDDEVLPVWQTDDEAWPVCYVWGYERDQDQSCLSDRQMMKPDLSAMCEGMRETRISPACLTDRWWSLTCLLCVRVWERPGPVLPVWQTDDEAWPVCYVWGYERDQDQSWLISRCEDVRVPRMPRSHYSHSSSFPLADKINYKARLQRWKGHNCMLSIHL